MGLFRRGDRDAGKADFAAYYQARGPSIRRTAYLLCHDWHLAEDLTQTTFIKLYQVWDRVHRHDVLDQYTRKILLRVLLDEKRRPWRREEVTSDDDVVDAEVVDALPEDRMLLETALRAVPPGQRAILVLRFWEDLSVDEVAEIMGCSAGNVKSQTARGLEKLRSALAAAATGGQYGTTAGGHPPAANGTGVPAQRSGRRPRREPGRRRA